MYADRILTVFCARDFACPAQLSSQVQFDQQNNAHMQQVAIERGIHQNKVDTLEQQFKDAGEKCERLEQAHKDLQRKHKDVQEKHTAVVSSRAPFAFL